jgi:putative transcriptional regulator
LTTLNSPASTSPALDALLASYASGALDPAMHALVATHLALCPTNRAFVNEMEASLAARITSMQPCEIARREARLQDIFAQDRHQATTNSGDDSAFKPLTHLLGAPVDALPFRFVMPGLREYRVPTRAGQEAMLYRIKPGARMPQHTHQGSEVTLVLRGSFSDETGIFGRGDISIADGDLDHDPIAGQGEECLCFAILDAPLRLTGPIGRLFNRFLPH